MAQQKKETQIVIKKIIRKSLIDKLIIYQLLNKFQILFIIETVLFKISSLFLNEFKHAFLSKDCS